MAKNSKKMRVRILARITPETCLKVKAGKVGVLEGIPEAMSISRRSWRCRTVNLRPDVAR